MPAEAEIWAWQRYMNGLGPRFTGNAAHHRFVDFIASGLADAGVPIERRRKTFTRWNARHWGLELHGRRRVRVASYYSYSGTTPPHGTEAPLAYVGSPDAGDLRGKIAVVEAPIAPLRLAAFYPQQWYTYDPGHTLHPTDDYKRAWTTLATLGPLNQYAAAGAAGVIFILDASPANAAGQYTPFIYSLQGIPALLLDREAGRAVRAAAKRGEPARMTLDAPLHPGATADMVVGLLPGQTDELIVVNTHTDGPNAVEENGGLALLAIARQLARLPLSKRRRGVAFVATQGHFAADVGDTQNFIDAYPDLVKRAVAAVTIEHLGTKEWLDGPRGYHGTGRSEVGVAYCSESPVVTAGIEGVRAGDLRRTMLLHAGVFFFGVGARLNLVGVPSVAYIAGPNYLLSFADGGHLDKVDRRLLYRGVRTFAGLVRRLDPIPAAILRSGVPQAVNLANDPQQEATDLLRWIQQEAP